MPPFLLEVIKHPITDNYKKNLFYSKRYYSPGVKVSGWERYDNSLPIDHDPFSREAYDLHLSHYDRLGFCENIKWSTTTQDMLEEFRDRRPELEMNPNKILVNLYTHMRSNCETHSKCSAIDGEDYITTMQHSYQPQYPFELKRLATPLMPYYLNRKLKNNGMCKFQDDDYILHTKRLQKHKKERQKLSEKMKKKFKARKTKNIAEKNSQGANYRFTVNPLIKQELLLLLNVGKNVENVEEEKVEPPVWKNFEIPSDFSMGLMKLSQRLGVYPNAISRYDI